MFWVFFLRVSIFFEVPDTDLKLRTVLGKKHATLILIRLALDPEAVTV